MRFGVSYHWSCALCALIPNHAQTLTAPPHLPSPFLLQACRRALTSRAYVRALLIALRLGDTELMRHCILSTPLAQVGLKRALASWAPSLWRSAAAEADCFSLHFSPNPWYSCTPGFHRSLCPSKGICAKGGHPFGRTAVCLAALGVLTDMGEGEIIRDSTRVPLWPDPSDSGPLMIDVPPLPSGSLLLHLTRSAPPGHSQGYAARAQSQHHACA